MIEQAQLDLIRGDTGEWDLTVERNGAAVDITGITARFMVKRSIDDANADALASLTVGNGITLTAPLTGDLRVTLPAATSALFPVTTLAWDLEITDGTGHVSTVAMGPLLVVADVSRAP
jgi:hypothetical protein